MWLLPSHFQYLRSAAIVVLAFAVVLPAHGQDRPRDLHGESAPPAPTPVKPPQGYGGGSPLDVLMHTKLWEAPPEPKNFVKESREPLRDLHYQPTTGTDPQRPKLLSPDQLKSLEGDLERAGVRNERAAGVKGEYSAPRDRRKTEARKAHRPARDASRSN